ncbi:hypothetical protein HYU91_00310 [Candidatus Collierbacteria bacterium]|nr:hypothetical protein [Candidatus Collierbacteria bacterium]
MDELLMTPDESRRGRADSFAAFIPQINGLIDANNLEPRVANANVLAGAVRVADARLKEGEDYADLMKRFKKLVANKDKTELVDLTMGSFLTVILTNERLNGELVLMSSELAGLIVKYYGERLAELRKNPKDEKYQRMAHLIGQTIARGEVMAKPAGEASIDDVMETIGEPVYTDALINGLKEILTDVDKEAANESKKGDLVRAQTAE